MHMADALLSPTVGGTMWALTIGTIVYSARKLKDKIDDKIIPLMGILGAFIFAGQMINFTIPATGSSGHIGGGMLLAILLGPYSAFLVISSVLIIQALFFADGGLLALGANIWNLGFYPCFIGYPLIFNYIMKNKISSKKLIYASIISVVISLQLGAMSVVFETKLSGITELPFGTFFLLMQPIHLAIGIIEGFITGAIVIYVRKLRPDLVENLENIKIIPSNHKIKNVTITIAIIALITGGILSWFASTYPDGLEWSIEKIYGKPEIPERPSSVKDILNRLQEKTSILPDYSLPSKPEKEEDTSTTSWPQIKPDTSLSGLLGSIMVIFLILLFGILIKLIRKTKAKHEI